MRRLTRLMTTLRLAPEHSWNLHPCTPTNVPSHPLPTDTQQPSDTSSVQATWWGQHLWAHHRRGLQLYLANGLGARAQGTWAGGRGKDRADIGAAVQPSGRGSNRPHASSTLDEATEQGAGSSTGKPKQSFYARRHLYKYRPQYPQNFKIPHIKMTWATFVFVRIKFLLIQIVFYIEEVLSKWKGC